MKGAVAERARSAPAVVAGTVASPGVAVGRLAVERTEGLATGPVGTEADERRRLDEAIKTASGALEALAARTDDDLAEGVLGFQIALLADPELTAPGEPLFVDGMGAAAAWRAGIGALITDYDAADDPYFRARAADLRDLEGRVLRALVGAPDAVAAKGGGDAPAILVVDELTPSRVLEAHEGVAAIAAVDGATTSHAAMLARARGLPLLTGLGCDLDALADHDGADPVVLDGDAGRLLLHPDGAALAAARDKMAEATRARTAADAAAHRPAITADGTPMTVLLNVEDPAALAAIDPAIAAGIGLTRTEFLFREGPADEATQLAAYRALLAWSTGRPVTIRTLDAGGDKPVPGVTVDGEPNPFLGVRGLRLSLARPDLFRTQLRALLRASADGPVKIMLPMVARPQEVAAARAHLAEAQASLASEGLPFGDPALGIMVETPAAALDAAAFDVDFYSIGTNDLVQYVMAAARDSAEVAHLQDPLAPPVLRLITEVAAVGRARGVEVSVCGEAASLPRVIPALVDRGIRVLSVPPEAVGRTKLALGAHHRSDV